MTPVTAPQIRKKDRTESILTSADRMSWRCEPSTRSARRWRARAGGSERALPSVRSSLTGACRVQLMSTRLSLLVLLVVSSWSLLLGGCAKNLVPFTQEMRVEHRLTDQDLKNLQFYVSHRVTLRREL